MIYLKKYEKFINPHEWKSIYTDENNELCVRVFNLATEMEDSIKKGTENSKGVSQSKIVFTEHKYYAIVKDLLIGKVITFYSEDRDERLTEVCYDVSFSASDYFDPEEFIFAFEYIFIHTRDEKYSIQDYDDLIVVHLDIEPNEFEKMKDYNL